jgi:hypothetical protein
MSEVDDRVMEGKATPLNPDERVTGEVTVKDSGCISPDETVASEERNRDGKVEVVSEDVDDKVVDDENLR